MKLLEKLNWPLVSIIIFTILFWILAFSVVKALSADFVAMNHVTYYGTTDNSFSVAWNYPESSATPIEYEIRMRHLERDQLTAIATVPHPNMSITLNVPRSGHYILEIRAVNDAGSSEWALSTDPESCENGVTWWVYGYVAPVGPIVIQ